MGTGDIGGAPDEESIRLLEAMVTHSEAVPPPPGFDPKTTSPPPAGKPVRFGEGPVHIVASAANQMFDDIAPAMTARMPRYKGDLELINHSTGSLTSQAYHKRWNRKNEILADAAEKASVAAAWIGGREYPYQRLNDAWFLVLSGQFHDVAAGTATPRAYQFAWNDDVIALNQFAGVLTNAVQAVASTMDTKVEGIPCVVSNQLDRDREDVVEATVAFPGGAPAAVRVVGPDGQGVPAQLSNGKVLFVARAPSVGFAVYDIQTGDRRAQNPSCAFRKTHWKIIAIEFGSTPPETWPASSINNLSASCFQAPYVWLFRPTPRGSFLPGIWTSIRSRPSLERMSAVRRKFALWRKGRLE